MFNQPIQFSVSFFVLIIVCLKLMTETAFEVNLFKDETFYRF